MKVIVRKLDAGDRDGWEALWQGYLAYYENPLPAETTYHVWSRLMTPGKGHDGFAAVDGDGKMVGIVHYLFHESTWEVEPVCYLEDLFVDPDTRGTGAGRALIQAVYDAADAAGLKRVYWHTENDNDVARRLYDRIGVLNPYVQYRWPK